MLPNFLVVGAAKAGTTSLHYYLQQHPDIFLPARKECWFFSEMDPRMIGPGEKTIPASSRITTSLDEYEKYFEESEKCTAIGEVSNDYLYFHETSIKNIKNILGSNVKIIIILRNPVERAFSNYQHSVSLGVENLSFEDAIQAELRESRKGWWFTYNYLKLGLYYAQVKAYKENFKRVKVYLFEEFIKDPLSVCADIFKIVGADHNFVPDTSQQMNKTYISKYPLFYHVYKNNKLISILKHSLCKVNAIEKNKNRMVNYIKNKTNNKMVINEETKQQLRKYYHDDIIKLSDVLERDLDGWLK